MSRKDRPCSFFLVQSVLLNIPFRLWSVDRSNEKTSVSSRSTHFTCLLLLLVLILGQLFMTVFVGIKACESLSAPLNPSIQSSVIVRVLAGVPNFFLSLRGLLVLLYLYRRRRLISDTCSRLTVLYRTCLHPAAEEYSRRSRQWLRLNIILTVYCISMFGTMFTLSWLHGFEFEKRSFSSPYHLRPIDMTIPTWTFMLLQIIFMYYPYLLSQVFLIATIVMTTVMRDCSKAINKSLMDLEANAKKVPRNFRMGVEVDCMTKDLEVLVGHRAAIFEFALQWNAVFGWILFLSYAVDVCASAGMLAVLVSDTERSQYVVWAKLIGSVGFVSFATALYAPLALASEEAEMTSTHVYKLTTTLYPLFFRELNSKLREVANDLRSMCLDFPIKFTAAEFLHMDRKSIVATFMLLASFSLLLIELLAEERSAGPTTRSNLTINGGT